MKAKGNSLVILPAAITTGRLAGINARGGYLINPRVSFVQRLASAGNNQPLQHMAHTCHLGEDLLETVSFTAIWLCCLGAVAACFI
jgi:hypothetical protein